jgi:hypothetical protein
MALGKTYPSTWAGVTQAAKVAGLMHPALVEAIGLATAGVGWGLRTP